MFSLASSLHRESTDSLITCNNFSVYNIVDKSFPKDVWYFLVGLKAQWITFATFVGFNKKEVSTIELLTPGLVEKQIKTFSKVWWMPELKEGKNCEILEEVSHQAGIVRGTYVKYVPCIPPFDITYVFIRRRCLSLSQ